jgi:hypothetical protein
MPADWRFTIFTFDIKEPTMADDSTLINQLTQIGDRRISEETNRAKRQRTAVDKIRDFGRHITDHVALFKAYERAVGEFKTEDMVHTAAHDICWSHVSEDGEPMSDKPLDGIGIWICYNSLFMFNDGPEYLMATNGKLYCKSVDHHSHLMIDEFIYYVQDLDSIGYHDAEMIAEALTSWASHLREVAETCIAKNRDVLRNQFE